MFYASPLPRRTLRSGKEFSAFDLALGRAIAPPIQFDVAQCLQTRLAEQDATGVQHEPDEDVVPFCDVPPPPPPPPVSLPHTSRARRDKKRDAARDVSANPLLKSVSLKRVSKAKASALEVDVDATALPHSKPSWLGSRAAGQAEFEFTPPAPPHDLSNGLGTKTYTQAELDAFSGTEGFMYIDWLGSLTVPIVDSRRRVIAVLGGMPRDLSGWKIVTDGAFKLLQERLHRIRLTDERLHHRRAQEAYAALARGWSHGGDRRSRASWSNNVANTLVTDELLAHDYFKRIAQFATILFALWAPLLFTFYQAQMMLLAAWKPSMRRNFAGGVFAACTFNFGPRAVTAPHLDFCQPRMGLVCDHSAREFDPDLGGHLILWDLRLVIRFPPGSTILLPSALIRHSNVDIRPHERSASFAQYTAGGLFRWVRNGFKTDEAFEMTASPDEMAARAEENGSRWEEGLKMFSTIDDL
ncbi:hypothetical protein C8R43DRAFT_1132861 [Mycena crocata]|nr:hypothetical protein C8R43DRAFT_1132861 [Mycena crocata]